MALHKLCKSLWYPKMFLFVVTNLTANFFVFLLLPSKIYADVINGLQYRLAKMHTAGSRGWVAMIHRTSGAAFKWSQFPIVKRLQKMVWFSIACLTHITWSDHQYNTPWSKKKPRRTFWAQKNYNFLLLFQSNLQSKFQFKITPP